MAWDKTPGQIAYEAWREARGEAASDPPWSDVGPKVRALWETTAEAVRDDLLDEQGPASDRD